MTSLNWTEEFHINKYVRKTDHREFNRPSRLSREISGMTRMIEKEWRHYKKSKDRLKPLDNTTE